MNQGDPTDDDDGAVETRPEIQVEHAQGNQELLARAARIRDRSRELIETLGPDHPWSPRPCVAPRRSNARRSTPTPSTSADWA